MSRSFFLATLTSAIILFVWGFVYWAMLGGLGAMSPVPNENEITRALHENIHESGTYYYPAMPESEMEAATETWIVNHKAGPLYMIFFHAGGADPGSPSLFVLGFLHYLIASALMCFLLTMALPNLQTYGKRLVFVLLTGIFASVFIEFSSPIWLYTPWSGAFSGLLYSGIGWLLAGAAIARFIKPSVPAS